MSHHEVGLHPEILYTFLKCAAPFEGEAKDYSGKITELIIGSNILTSNVRNNQADAWRDYQQLLAELGLIYSTLISRTLKLTDIAHMFLAGELGFSELIGIQALRYQYPNGQHSPIQSKLRAELENSRLVIPKTLIELQARERLLLKPGLLILRVLLELLVHGQAPELSVRECQAFLIPCRSNDEWGLAVSEILSNRRSGNGVDECNSHSKRNVQSWFRLLSCSDIFEINESRAITLSKFAIQKQGLLKNYSATQADPGQFWIPTQFDKAERMAWFEWFGSPPLSAQAMLRADPERDPSYVQRNYTAGLEEEMEYESRTLGGLGVNLRLLDLEKLERESTMRAGLTIDAMLENLQKGMQKRHAKALLHDRIVKELAEKFIAQGATVESDPDSIDLYASWPSGASAIFEVKTVTQRSIQLRLRTAIGQVEEYSFRRERQFGKVSDRVIVVNADIGGDAWQRQFLTDYLRIGLICKTGDSYTWAAPAECPSSLHWKSALSPASS